MFYYVRVCVATRAHQKKGGKRSCRRDVFNRGWGLEESEVEERCRKLGGKVMGHLDDRLVRELEENRGWTHRLVDAVTCGAAAICGFLEST